MTGIDHRSAELELREAVGFSAESIKALLPKIKQKYNLSGVAMIATCNRTELYVSYRKGVEQVSPLEMLFAVADLQGEQLRACFQSRQGGAVCRYLFEVSAGIHSMLFGDAQIVSQVNAAIEWAREVRTADAVLNTLFRHAVTCAKLVKSKVVLKFVSTSVATQCRDVLNDYIKTAERPRAVVVGNGEIGRIVCRELRAAGCEVLVTFRQYKHHKLVVPQGCMAINYADREQYFEGADIVVSATSSPHHTITCAMIENLKVKPKYLVDLAVPRDIEPQVKSLAGIVHYDIDSMGRGAQRDNSRELVTVLSFVEDQLAKFYEWLKIHECSTELLIIKNIIKPKIINNIEHDEADVAKLERAVDKTLGFMFYNLKEHLSADLLSNLKSGALEKK